MKEDNQKKNGVKSLLNRLNPKSRLMEKAMSKFQDMTAKDVHSLFEERLLPFLQMNPKIEFVLLAKDKRVYYNGKQYYAVFWRDV